MTTTTAPTLRHALDVLESTVHEAERQAGTLFDAYVAAEGNDENAFNAYERAQGRADGLLAAVSLVRDVLDGRC